MCIFFLGLGHFWRGEEEEMSDTWANEVERSGEEG